MDKVAQYPASLFCRSELHTVTVWTVSRRSGPGPDLLHALLPKLPPSANRANSTSHQRIKLITGMHTSLSWLPEASMGPLYYEPMAPGDGPTASNCVVVKVVV